MSKLKLKLNFLQNYEYFMLKMLKIKFLNYKQQLLFQCQVVTHNFCHSFRKRQVFICILTFKIPFNKSINFQLN